MPLKRARKPLPWWLVVILSLIGVVVAAAIISAVLDSGHHEGMPAPTSAAVLVGDGCDFHFPGCPEKAWSDLSASFSANTEKLW